MEEIINPVHSVEVPFTYPGIGGVPGRTTTFLVRYWTLGPGEYEVQYSDDSIKWTTTPHNINVPADSPNPYWFTQQVDLFPIAPSRITMQRIVKVG